MYHRYCMGIYWYHKIEANMLHLSLLHSIPKPLKGKSSSYVELASGKVTNPVSQQGEGDQGTSVLALSRPASQPLIFQLPQLVEGPANPKKISHSKAVWMWIPLHPRASLKITGSAVQKNLSPLSQLKSCSHLFTGEHYPNIATWPAGYTDPGLRQSEGLLDCTTLPPDCRASGSQLRMLLGPCPRSPHRRSTCAGCSVTSKWIHNSAPPAPEQLPAQKVPQKEAYKPTGFQRFAEIWYTK